MSKTLRNVSVAIALMVASTPLLMSSQASALSMTECSAKFKADKAAAKAAGTEFTTKWNDYRKANCAADAAAAPAAPATAVAAPAAPAAKPPKMTTAAPAAPAAPAMATTASGSFMKDCSTAWKAMKAANTTPAGMTWKQFVAAKCVVPGAAPAAPATKVAAPAPGTVAPAPMAKVAPAVIAPAEPSDKPDTTPLATADKNGKPFTPGQMAAHKRIRECADQWRALKASNKVPAGTKWPQFWSACNKQLKAAGQ